MTQQQIDQYYELLDAQRYDETLAFLSSIIAADDKDITAHIFLAEGYTSHLENYNDGLKLYNIAGQLISDEINADAVASVNHQVAAELVLIGRTLCCNAMGDYASAANWADGYIEQIGGTITVNYISNALTAYFNYGGLAAAEAFAKRILRYLKNDTEHDLAERERMVAVTFAHLSALFIENATEDTYRLVDGSVSAIARLRRYCSIASSYGQIVHGEGGVGKDFVDIYAQFMRPWRVVNGSLDGEPVEANANTLVSEIMTKGMFGLPELDDADGFDAPTAPPQPSAPVAPIEALPTPASTPQAHTQGAYAVILTSAGNNLLPVIRKIRELTGLELTDAKRIVENVPSTVIAAGTLTEAEGLQRDFEALGAQVVISSNGTASVVNADISDDALWYETIAEDTALRTITTLKNLFVSYQNDLSNEKHRYEGEKSRASNNNKSALEAIRAQAAAEVAADEETLRADLEEINGIERKYTAFHEDLAQLIYANSRYSKIRTLIEKLVKNANTGLARNATAKMQVEERSFAELISAVNAEREARQAHTNTKIDAANTQARLSTSETNADFRARLDALLDTHKSKAAELDARYSTNDRNLITDASINKYINSVRSALPSAESFECATSLPDFIYIGEASINIATHSDAFPEVVQRLSSDSSKAVSEKKIGNESGVVATLPYCQRLDDGISLLVNYSHKDRPHFRDKLRMLMLKFFMSFPAGKLEATMIDPLELGETFAIFTKLGEEQSRIIDTKIWSQEKDIGECVNILRQKLETMTQSYGDDREARLKKEPVRVLAITDFPTGFSQNALRDLQAIVRKSASLGLCVFIWANSAEIENMAAAQQSIFNEITQMLHVASSRDGVLYLESPVYPDIMLELDDMPAARENSAAIIAAISKGIHDSQRKIEYFHDMFDDIADPNNWFNLSSREEIAIPLGIKGANSLVKMNIGKKGSIAHHALIAGQTGGGKSTFFHTLIMSTMLNYSPDEVQMYLVDFKEGIEFKVYTRFNLPSLRVVAIDSEREFGLNVLRELTRELETRATAFSRAGVTEIDEYKKVTKAKLPSLILVFDEVQDLFRESGADDGIVNECVECLKKLVTQGRSMGIHIILSSQDFNLTPALKPLFTSMAIRIAIKGSESSAESVLGGGNAGAKQLQNEAAGAAIYNDANGVESANTVFQIAYLPEADRLDLLSRLSAIQNNEALAGRYGNRTRVLLTSAEDDVFNAFNRFISVGEVTPFFTGTDTYGLLIGEGFDLKRKFLIGIESRDRANLLLIGKDEKRAAAVFYMSMLSILYDEISNPDVKKDNQLIMLVDLSAEDEYAEPDSTTFVHIKSKFDSQIKRVNLRDMEDAIGNVYDTLQRRMRAEESVDERLFLMFFGINRAQRLASSSIYEETDIGEVSTLSKIQEIVRRGGRYGINCIFWGENTAAVSRVLGSGYENDFPQRIVFATDAETQELLVNEERGSSLRATTAVYMDISSDVKNTHFRPYEVPMKMWVDKFAKTYKERIGD